MVRAMLPKKEKIDIQMLQQIYNNITILIGKEK